MNVIRTMVLSAGMLVLGLVATPASATILDQNFVTTDDPNHGTGIGFNTATSLAQSFTVGITGALAAVEFNILKVAGTNGDLKVDIRPLVSGDSPDPDASDALGSVIVDNGVISTVGAQPYSWTTLLVDFSAANIAVTAGDMLAFVLTTTLGEEFAVQTDFLNAYSGGKRWHQAGDGNAFGSVDADLAFKTYVNVPEPASLALLGIGLAGLGISRRKRI